MNIFYKFLLFLQSEMTEPKPWGWYHLMWIGIIILALIILAFTKTNNKNLNKVLLIYGLIALILEALKQVTWAFNYDSVTNIVTWDYQWYAAPFQLCTTPIFACIIAACLNKNSKLKGALLSYVAFFTILGSIATVVMPTTVFTKTILVNIHTMWLHCGSLVVSIYLIMKKIIKPNFKNFLNASCVFLIFVLIADILNILVYNSNILNGATFNMFYISPYFTSELPVFSLIQDKVPYFIYLLFYILILNIGAYIVFFTSKVLTSNLHRK